MRSLGIIVACSLGWSMGLADRLPWSYLSEDMQHFKDRTLGRALIMGRTTYQSIGRPLPNRRNIVITRGLLRNCDVEVVPTWEYALERAYILDSAPMVIGGAQVYQKALPFATDIYLTCINRRYSADTFFPNTWLSLFECFDVRSG